MESGFIQGLLVSFTLVSFARADYYIDDQNYTSLLYSENPSGAKWGPFQQSGESLSLTLANGTRMSIDASRCFNETYTCESFGRAGSHPSTYSDGVDAACTITDNCQVQIPFTGSGITIYVLQAGAQGINASLTIDGGTPTYNSLPAPSGPNFYAPNVTLFSIQGITTGSHTATMTVLNYDNKFSGMMFDYALINQRDIAPAAASSVTSSSSSLPLSSTLTLTSTLTSVLTLALTSSSASTTSLPTTVATSLPSKPAANIGAIVGGIIGGLAALSLAFLAIFYLHRRRRLGARSFQSANLDAEPNTNPLFSLDSLHNPPTIAARYTDVRDSSMESLMIGPVRATYTPPQSKTPLMNSASARPEKWQLGVANPSMDQIVSANGSSAALARTDSSSLYTPGVTEAPLPSSRMQIRQAHPTLSDDQADFVNNLYANNVPASAIARVIERMMAGEQQPVVDGYGFLSPPSYDHATSDA